jgi:hypothetical protein
MATPFPFTSGQILTAAQMNSIAEAAISYTPTVGSLSGTITSKTVVAKYMLVNKLCFVQFSINITNNGTGGTAVTISPPFTANASYGNVAIGVCRDTAITGTLSECFIQSGTAISIITYNNAYPGATGAVLSGSFTYEVA